MRAEFAPIFKLGRAERLQMVEDLWDSIAKDSAGLPLSEARRVELDRRLAEHEADPQDVIPWEEVKAAAAARHKG